MDLRTAAMKARSFAVEADELSNILLEPRGVEKEKGRWIVKFSYGLAGPKEVRVELDENGEVMDFEVFDIK